MLRYLITQSDTWDVVDALRAQPVMEFLAGRVLRYDPETYFHQIRTAYLAADMGIEAGFAEHDLTTLIRSSLLHDRGKLAIPLNILQKPQQLTSEEKRLMEMHPVFTYFMLKRVGLHEEAAVALSHHEWKRSGYRRKRGRKRQCPLVEDRRNGEKHVDRAAQILTAADTLDPLVFERSYMDPPIRVGLIGAILQDELANFNPYYGAVLKRFSNVHDRLLTYRNNTPHGL